MIDFRRSPEGLTLEMSTRPRLWRTRGRRRVDRSSFIYPHLMNQSMSTRLECRPGWREPEWRVRGDIDPRRQVVGRPLGGRAPDRPSSLGPRIDGRRRLRSPSSGRRTSSSTRGCGRSCRSWSSGPSGRHPPGTGRGPSPATAGGRRSSVGHDEHGIRSRFTESIITAIY